MDATYNLKGGFMPTNKRNANLDGPDFYPTPPWATYALMENESFSGDVWECACGDGAMSDVISRYVPKVHSSDLYDHGFGETGVDFLKAKSRAANIIPIHRFTAQRGSCILHFRKPDQKFAFLCAWHSLKAPTAQTPSFT